MAFGEFGLLLASAIVRFKGDTSDLKAKIRELQGEEKKLAQAQLAAAEARNKGYESWSKGLAKAAVVTQVATKALGVATDGWKEYEKYAKRAGGADEERARGFRSALETWNSGMNSLQVQIGKMVASLAPLVELAGTIVGYAADAIGVVGNIVGGVVGSFDTHAPMGAGFKGTAVYGAMQKSQASSYITDPARAQKLIQVVQALAASGLITGSAITTQRYADGVAGNVKLTPEQATLLDALGIASPLVGGAFRGTGQWNFKEVLEGLKAPTRGAAAPVYDVTQYRRGDGVQRGAIRMGAGGREMWNGYAWVPAPFSDAIGSTPYGTSSGQTAGLGVGIQFGSLAADFQKLADTFAEVGEQYAQKKTLLEQIFGPFDSFDAYAEKMTLLGDAVGVFSGALKTGFDAWVAGSKTASQAIKGVFADTIRGIASSLFAHGIEHGAMAIGSLAFQDYRGAALHGKAAVAYGAGAVAVGALARQLGGGASTSAGYGAGTSGGGGSYSLVGDHRSARSETRIYYVGEGWSTSPAQQRQQFSRVFRASSRELESVEGVRDA